MPIQPRALQRTQRLHGRAAECMWQGWQTVWHLALDLSNEVMFNQG